MSALFGLVPAKNSRQLASPSPSVSASAPASEMGNPYWTSHHFGTLFVTTSASKYASTPLGPLIVTVTILDVPEASPPQCEKWK